MNKLALSAALVLLAACGGHHIPVNKQQTYYLQTNLRAHGNVVTSVNEWEKQTVLPMCTPVRLQWARGREIRFVVNGKTYRYIMYRGSRLPLNTHLKRVFGPSCPKGQLSQVDQLGVQRSRPYVGMSKRGVIGAVGYPPDHKTPSLQRSPWTYWGTRGRVKVHWRGDVVSRIEGAPDEPAVANSRPMGATRAVGGQGPHGAPPRSQGGQGAPPLRPPGPGQGTAGGTAPPPGGGGTGTGGGTAPPPGGGSQDDVGRLCKSGDPCPEGLECVEDERGIGHCQPVP